jgi:hypothetical protein
MLLGRSAGNDDGEADGVSLGSDQGNDDGRTDEFDEGNSVEAIVVVPKGWLV